MNYDYIPTTDYTALYEYQRSLEKKAPYWFDTDKEIWLKSFSDDCDLDGEDMFNELITYTAVCEGRIVGFVQFGIPCYIYGDDGEKDYDEVFGVIRALYFESEHSACGKVMTEIAHDYFAAKGVKRRFAFYHALGMTCFAGHGKLYCGFPHIEEALNACGYIKEHENVYYRRFLSSADSNADENVTLSFNKVSESGLAEFSVFLSGEFVGAGALVYLPQGDIAYLKWIFILDEYQGRGLASAALRLIFAELYSRGFKRIDTDTADGNLAAQGLYTKLGFEDMGRTRSYMDKP